MQSKPVLNLKSLLKLALRDKRLLIFGNCLGILAAVCSVPVPLLTPTLVDEVLLDKPGWLTAILHNFLPTAWQTPVALIVTVMLITITLRMASTLLQISQTRLFTRISKALVFKLRSQVLSHLQHVSMAEYETMGSGEVSSYLIKDIDTIDVFISESISKFVVATLSILGVAIVLLFMHWQIATIILLFNPLVIYVTTRLGATVKNLKQKENNAFQWFQEAITQTLDAMHELRIMNRDKNYIHGLIHKARLVRDTGRQFSWQTDVANRLSFLVFLFGFDVFRAIAMIMVLLSDLSIGQMIAIFSYLWFMMGPVQELLNVQYQYYAASAALERIQKLFSLKEEPQYHPLKNPFDKNDDIGISAHKLSFSYVPDQPVLNEIDFDIAPGEKIAIVGASGGGKSTLVQLLLGVYQPSHGHIKINDDQMSEIGLSEIRNNMGCVLQHPAMLPATIRENLTLGQETDDAKIWQALKMACLADVVHHMPDGLDTFIGQRGIKLSGGQKQRLAIARMILTNPKIVVLDEATSMLDVPTEKAIHRNLRDFLKSKTTIIVAHRLSAIQEADRVLVFDGGAIVERGHHQDLMDNGGLFAKMYQ